jgi:hypothetical protein
MSNQNRGSVVLHRVGAKPWVFDFDERYMSFTHRTTRGSVYVIATGLIEELPFKIWLVGRPFYIDESFRLRCQKIEFPNGGTYVFPKRKARQVLRNTQ